MSSTPTISDYFKSLGLYLLPHHFISRLVYAASRWQTPLKNPIKRWFVKHFDVDMSEAMEEDAAAYPTFNAFFTRALKPGTRPVVENENVLVSPADGRISQLGEIRDGRIFQAKGRDYSLHELLGGSEARIAPFVNGRFMTIYLSPRDYHRVHMPTAGRLTSMVHVPGRLFSVAPHTVRTVPRLFARNERVACQFKTDGGMMSMVLVGAINVAAIETVWAGLVTPPRGREISERGYGDSMRIELDKGAEMGRFNMGSTVILLMEESVQWEDGLEPGMALKMGQAIGRRPSA